MLIKEIRLAWQFHQQEKHYPHQHFLRWTQAILMIFVVSLSQTSQTIQDYLTLNLANLLGADLVLSQQQPITQRQNTELINISKKIVLTQTLITTLTYKGKWQRAKLKAVGNGYPLQGELKISSSLDGNDESTLSGPAPGEMWLDPRLFASLSVRVGDVIRLADQPFTVSRVLKHEPDRLMEAHNVDMRAMINLHDLDRLQFRQASIEFRYLFAANQRQITKIIEWQRDNLPASQIHHKHGSHPLALFWKRTEHFIGLTSIILFFMAAIAIEQLSHVQTRKEQQFSAVCMSLGETKWSALQISVFKWLFGVFLLIPVVLLVSVSCHWLIIQWLTSTFEGLTWQWNMSLALKSLFAISAIFMVFQAPIWFWLTQSSVRQLVHNTSHKVSYWLPPICALLVLVAVAFVYSDNGLLTLMILTSLGISVLLILAISWSALTLGEKCTKNVSGIMPFALFMMRQRLMIKSTQILGVGLCAFLLLFTLMFLRDLSNTMTAYSRLHDGNLLVSQATQKQMQDIESWAQTHDINIRQRKSYIYAKLIKIDGQLLDEFIDKPSDSQATFLRPIRLHWTSEVPANNRVIDGQWWEDDSSLWQQISVEQEVMTDMGLKLGDQMTFFIGNQSVDFTITASHAYKPGAGSITFWVQMPPSALTRINAPYYSMASLELASQQFSLLGGLWQRHPSLRMMPLKEMTARFDSTLAIITKVISGFSLLIIVLAVIVILSSIHALGTKEKQKNCIIMSFGFNRQTCLRLNVIEWIVTGAIAASGAIVGTYIAGLLIYQSQFSMNYQPNFLWLSGTLVVILLVVASLGVFASKSSLSESVRELMAEL